MLRLTIPYGSTDQVSISDDTIAITPEMEKELTNGKGDDEEDD